MQVAYAEASQSTAETCSRWHIQVQIYFFDFIFETNVENHLPIANTWAQTHLIWSRHSSQCSDQSYLHQQLDWLWLTAGHLTHFHTSWEMMKHTLKVLISLHCVYRDDRLTSLWPYWPSFCGFALLVFGGPLSPQAVGEDMYVWRRVNEHQPGSAPWWEPQKDPMCRKKSEQLSKHCRRCEPRSHHAMSLINQTIRYPQTTSHAHKAVSVPAPTFLLPSSHSHQAQLCDFQLLHIMPQHPLEDRPLHFFSLLLHTLSFFPSPPVIPWISLVLKDMMSSEVFMFVLWV